MTLIRNICVYCGSGPGSDPAFVGAARTFGKILAQNGIGLVYGGGSIGLMGELANAVLDHGGKAIGIIPEFLLNMEIAHRRGDLIVTRDMHERKQRMFEHADAFVALPGGIGTFEELFEIWTWGYLGLHDKPMGLLDTDGFYAPLLTFLDGTVDHGFMAQATRDMLLDAPTPAHLLDMLEAQLR